MRTFLKNWKIWLTALGAAIAFSAVTPELAYAGHNDSDSDSVDSDSDSDDRDRNRRRNRRNRRNRRGNRGGGGGGSAANVPELDGKMAPAGMAVVAIGALLISARRRDD